jgi:hypothetical protein
VATNDVLSGAATNDCHVVCLHLQHQVKIDNMVVAEEALLNTSYQAFVWFWSPLLS